MSDDERIAESPEAIQSKPRSGGPRTVAGKAVSRANAVKHGLTATTLIPAALRSGRVAALRRQLEKDPLAVLESAMLDEIARHVDRLEIAQRAEEAVLREGAREEARRTADSDDIDQNNADRLLAAAVVTPGLELCTRYRRSHERSLDLAWRSLAILKERKGGIASASVEATFEEPCFGTEAACEAYLHQRFHAETWRCSRCGHPNGHWLATRKLWECGGCKRQVGLRSGTVLERSPVTLLAWFRAIQLVIQCPGINTRELVARIGIARVKTVRAMARKIRAAVTNDSRRPQLAGLDQIFRQSKISPEAGAPC